MIASQATNYAATYGAFKMTIAVSWFLVKLIMFFAVAYFLTSRFLRLSARTGIQKRPRQMLIGYLLLIASLYAWAAMHFGSFAAVGVASLGGGLLGASTLEAKEKIAKGFDSFLASVPVGILLVAIGMEVNVKAAEGSILFLTALVIVVVGAKLIGCWIATNKRYASSGERVLIMFGVLVQSEMGVVITAYLFARGLLNPSSFDVVIIAVVLLIMAPAALLGIAPTEKGTISFIS
jgi:Kef-type K+ transport system membrane component KefB